MCQTKSHINAEVLIAIAQGKNIQFRGQIFPFVWKDWNPKQYLALNPLNSSCGYEWRIKPEPKPDIVVFRNAYPNVINGAWGYSTLEQAKKECARKPMYDDSIVKETFDGETHKLKSVEIVK